MRSKSGVLVAVALVAALVWLLVRGSDAVAPPTAPAAHGSPPAAVVGPVQHQSMPGRDVAEQVEVEREAAPEQGDAATAGSVLRGVVVDSDGNAIVTARVALFAGLLHDDAQPVATTDTGADGSFTFSVRSGNGPWALRATASEYLAAELAGVSAHETARLTLRPVVVVFGRVVARRDGAPIAGATVRGGVTPVVSDQAGGYEIRTTPRQSLVTLTARAPGFAERRLELLLYERQPTSIDFELSPMTSLTVQVVDRQTGAPIPGAVARRSHRTPVLAHAEADGLLTTDVAAGEALRLHIEADGYFPASWQWTVPDGDLPQPMLPLVRSARVLGRVTDLSGRPVVAGVGVRFGSPVGGPYADEASDPRLHAVPGTFSDALSGASTTSDEQGHFELDVCAGVAGQHVVAALPDCVSASSGDLSSLQPGETRRITLVLVVGGIVQGVAHRNGEPMRSGYVFCRGAATVQGWVNDEGRYELRGLTPGRVELLLRLGLSTPVLQAVAVDVVAGERVDCDFDWRSEAITGRVTTTAGAAVAGAFVQAYLPDRESDVIAGTRTNADGTYQLDVPRGRYAVTAGRANGRHGRRAVSPPATGVDFVLPAAGRLRLRFVDAGTRRPVLLGSAAFRIAWRIPGEPAFRTYLGDSDVAGLLELELPVGAVDIACHVSHLGYVPCVRLGLAVTATEPPNDVQIELARGAQVHLVVRGPTPFGDEQRAEHVLFLLEDRQLASVRGPLPPTDPAVNWSGNGVHLWLGDPGLMNQVPEFDESGRATLPGLAPGRYRLAAFPDDLVFEPATFPVGETDTHVELRWRRR